jgi:phosphopantetheinyl transferase (holo-ACP synthase)
LQTPTDHTPRRHALGSPGPFVGNDVVDLADARAACAHRDRRFVERVCGADEIVRAKSPRELWTLFAAKEAAYKALVKLGVDPGFRHRAIRVAADRQSVAYGDTRLALSVADGEEYVHAFAWTGAGTPMARVAQNDGRETDEGSRARALLCAMVAAAIGCEADELAVVRDPAVGAWDGYGPPRVERASVGVGADVSLSHDGRFVAAAAVLVEGRVVSHWRARAARPRVSGERRVDSR